jgi:hypothetical protein
MSHDFNLVPHVAVSLTLVAPVRADSSTKESDVQTIYDNISTENKGLFWIEGTTCRFGGYDYFGEKQNSEDAVCVHYVL